MDNDKVVELQIQALSLRPGEYLLEMDKFNRDPRRNVLGFYLASIGPVGVSVLILLPSLVALISARFVSANAGTTASAPIPAVNLLGTALTPLAYIAWTTFGLSVLAQIASVAYSLSAGKWVLRTDRQSRDDMLKRR